MTIIGALKKLSKKLNTGGTEASGKTIAGVLSSIESSFNINGAPGADGKDGKDGQDGQDGTDGVTFTPSVSSAGVISWTNDGGQENPQSVDLVAAVISALPSAVGVSF